MMLAFEFSIKTHEICQSDENTKWWCDRLMTRCKEIAVGDEEVSVLEEGRYFAELAKRLCRRNLNVA